MTGSGSGARHPAEPDESRDGGLDGTDPFAEFLTAPQQLPRPIRWDDLEPQAHAAALHDLADWVRWLVVRYAMDQRDVPLCWYRHGALVEELSALRGAWQIAYDPTQPATAAVDWHATLAYGRQRLREWAARTGCRQREHRPDSIEPWAAHPDESGWTTTFYIHLDSIVDPPP